MKIKFNVAQGSAVFSYKNDDATMEEAVDLLKRDEVISLSVTKQTPTQYLKTQRALNDSECGKWRGDGN